jgi:hypothetical protein
MNNTKPYQAPVDRLLQDIEFHDFGKEWPDYLALYGFTAADLPELIRLSLDEEPSDCENDEWMLHGLIAVAQLAPKSAIDLYLQQIQVFFDDYLLLEESSRLCRNVGKIAIEPCASFLQNTAEDEWSRIAVVDGLEAIAKSDADSRDTCVQVMMNQLSLYKLENSPLVPSALVDNLVALQAVEAADLIESAFTDVGLDEMRTGSWPAVQVKLGLKSKSDFSPEELKPNLPPKIVEIRELLDQLATFQPPTKRVKTQFGRNQEPLNFSNQTALQPKNPGFGSSQPRQKKNKKKKR